MNNFKRFVSVFVAAMLVLSSIKFSDYIAKAEPSVQSSKGKVVYDFEEDVSVNWKFSGYNANDLVSLETETVSGETNHYLKMSKSGNWNPGYVVFPLELENGATYKVSYDYKVDKAFTGRVGLTASAATNGVLGSASSGHGNTPSVVSPYYYDTKWVKFNVTPWTTVTNTITVGASDITDTIKYFSIYFSGTTGGAYDVMYLDNIVIKKVDPNLTEYDFEEDVSVNWKFSGYNANDLVSLETETVSGETNHYLKMSKCGNWNPGYVVFPLELENGATYKVSYDYKVDKAFTGRVGLTASAATNGVLGDAGSGHGNTPSVVDPFYYDTKWVKFTNTDWTTVSNTITVTNVTDTIKYFSIYFSGTTGGAYDVMYLDNIVIKKVDPNLTEYDFEEDVSVNWKFSGYNDGDLVSLETETVSGETNHYLKMSKCGNWNPGYVVFPLELENGATYKVSYDYKVDKAFTGRVGLTASAATNGVLGDAGSGHGNTPSVVSPYYYDTKWVKFTNTDWTTVSNTITVTNVTDTIKYFSIYFSGTTGGAYDVMYLDNIVIKKESSGSVIHFKAYVNGAESSEISLEDIKGNPGTTAALDCLDVPGYKRLGIYKDEALTDEFTGTEFTISEDPVTYYVNYEAIPARTINFVAYEGDTLSTKITIPPVNGLEGETVSFNHLKVFGYDVVGIFKDAGLTDEFTGNEFTIGSTATTYYVKYAAKTYNGGVYDFETDAKSFLDFGIQVNENSADVAVVSDAKEDGNKCLRLYNSGWKGMIVNFPYRLKNNTSYRITYRLRSDEGVKVRSDAGGANASQASCIYAGKSTGVTSTSGNKIEVKDYLKNYLAYLYDVPGQTGTSMYGPSLPKEWTTQSWTFTTGADTVDDTFKYLAFNFYPTCDADKYATLYLDDIVIEEVSSIRFVAYENGAESSNIKLSSIEGDAGVTRSVDCLSIAGYDIEGIYTDSTFTTPFTGDVFTLSKGVTTYYVKYVKNDKIYRLKFENSSDIKKLVDRAAVTTDPDGSGNKVLAFGNNWRESLASFPYELKPNTTYTLKLSYRSSSEGIVPRLYVYAVKDGSKLLENDAEYTSKRQFSIMDSLKSQSSNSMGSTVFDDNGEWITKEYSFTTNDEVDSEYKYFALGGKVQFYAESNSECLLVDNIEIKKLDATVSFNVSYDGQKIDVPTQYPSLGDTITLPTTLTNPFKLVGWYYDEACTQAVNSSTLTVTNKNTVIYGKASKVSTFKLDFESSGQVIDGQGNWFCIGGTLNEDPENSGNRVLKLRSEGFNNYALVRLNYQLQPNRIYNISVRYYGDNNPANMALIVSGIGYPENGMGIKLGTGSNVMSASVLPFVTQEKIYSNWQTASLKITTDQPVIDDENKYLTVYYATRTGDIGPRQRTIAYIDDIVIEDLGPFNPTDVEIESADKWTLPTEDSSIWKDWSSWITGEIESIFDTDNDDNQNDNNDDNNFEYNYENTGNSFEVNNEPEESTENTEEQQPTRKKKVIKKVIVTEGSNTVIIVVVVVVAVVLVGGGITAFIIIRKRRGRIS